MTSVGPERTALVAGGVALLVLAVAVHSGRWDLAATAAVPAAVAVRALWLGVEVHDGQVVVRNLVRTKRVPLAEVGDVIVDVLGPHERLRAALRLRSGFDIPIDAITAGYDDASRRRVHEEVADLRHRIHELRRGGEI